MSDTRSYSSLVTHDTTGYVGFANLPNQVFIDVELTKKSWRLFLGA